MTRVYVIGNFLSGKNRKQIDEVCGRYGYEVSCFDTVKDADGKVSDGEIIYCTGPAVLDQMKHLKWCHSASAGVDRFLQTGIFDSGDVLLTNSSGAYGRAISEHIIMVSLMLLRRMPEYLEITGCRGWRHDLRIRSIAGSTVAIVGTGNLGSTAASKFKALGAERVIGFSRSGRPAEPFDEVYRMSGFEEKIGNADIVVMCVPGTPETAALMNADRIAALPERSFLINVGRGTSVDQGALITALNEGRIAGAALDVVVPEPLPADHPLWTAKNCIITPHCSGDMALEYTVDVTVDLFCENLKRYAEGEELIRLIDPSVGY